MIVVHLLANIIGMVVLCVLISKHSEFEIMLCIPISFSIVLIINYILAFFNLMNLIIIASKNGNDKYSINKTALLCAPYAIRFEYVDFPIDNIYLDSMFEKYHTDKYLFVPSKDENEIIADGECYQYNVVYTYRK